MSILWTDKESSSGPSLELHLFRPSPSVPNKGDAEVGGGVSGQTSYKVSCMTRLINRKFMMVWREHWVFDPLKFLVDTLPSPRIIFYLNGRKA